MGTDSSNVQALSRFVIRLPLAGPIVGYARKNPHPRPEGTDDQIKAIGWRPWVWTRDPSLAARWGSRLAAESVLAELAAAPLADVVDLEVASITEIPR
jgi:hypothetical protein